MSNTVTECSDEEDASHSQHSDDESVDGIHMESGNILDEEHGNLGGMEDSSGEYGDETYGDDDSELELAPELQAIKGYYAIYAKQPALKIWIPGSKLSKRKYDSDCAADTSEADDPSANARKKSKPSKASKRAKKAHNPGTKNVIKPRSRGRPRKEGPKDFSVPVYVEIAQPPILERGKTPKGDKFVKQPPVSDGPFNITPEMSWHQFVDEIVVFANVERENIDMSSTKWSFQKKNPLPLKDAVGYETMKKQIQGMKDPDSAIIIVALTTPRPTKHERQAAPVPILDIPEKHQDDGSLYGRKLSFDDQIAPILERLNDEHEIGTCATHPSIRCYVLEPQGWHFDLNSNRMKVWANSILRKQTSYGRIPIGSNFFNPKDHASNTSVQPFFPSMSPWNLPNPSLQQFSSPLYPFVPCNMHPQHMQQFVPPTPSPVAHHVGPGCTHQHFGASASISAVPAQVTKNPVEEWCQKYALDDDDC
ncbi:hypothetical protein EDB19DRAFT_1921441 [Suillus lakei]|nr:hypothetical protein EDB19DRAFT_1921441 [Suillus lakei]